MLIRRLQPAEWEKIYPVFEREFGENPPAPDRSMVVVAEEQGMIVGLLAVQLIVHAEPLWVKQSHRDKYIVPQLVAKAKELLPDANYCFVHTDNPKVGKLLEKIGFTKMQAVLYRWLRS